MPSVFSTIGKVLGSATTTAAGAGVAFDPATAVANLANNLVSRFLPDKTAQDAAKVAITEMQLNGEFAEIAGQIQINVQEAASSHVFVSGWRPFIGWICGVALLYEMLLRPVTATFLMAAGNHAIPPQIQIQDLMTILAGLLGLGAMRTVEKVNDVPAAKDSV